VSVQSVRLELWQRALHNRAKTLYEESNRGASARLALAELLARCGLKVTLVTIHTWPRQWQGSDYLWAYDRTIGIENNVPPEFLWKLGAR